jgi:hypothetical protein
LSFIGEVVTSKFVKVLAEATPEQGKDLKQELRFRNGSLWELRSKTLFSEINRIVGCKPE